MRKHGKLLGALALTSLLGGCVTINVYPGAANPVTVGGSGQQAAQPAQAAWQGTPPSSMPPPSNGWPQQNARAIQGELGPTYGTPARPSN